MASAKIKSKSDASGIPVSLRDAPAPTGSALGFVPTAPGARLNVRDVPGRRVVRSRRPTDGMAILWVESGISRELLEKASSEWCGLFPRVERKICLTSDPLALEEDTLLSYIETAKRYYHRIYLCGNSLAELKNKKKVADLLLNFGDNPLIPTFQVNLYGRRKVHDSIMGKGDYSKVMSGIREFARVSRKSRRGMLAFEFLVSKDNCGEKEIEHVFSIASGRRGLGTRVNVLPDALREGEEMGFDWWDFLKKVRKANSVHAVLAVRGSCGVSSARCFAGVRTLYINKEGDVFACRMLKNAVGNLEEEPLHDLLNVARGSVDRERFLPCIRLGGDSDSSHGFNPSSGG